MRKFILKTLVGSRAHKLSNNESDFDYRGVFVNNTRELLKINGDVKDTFWYEGDKDDTYYEVGKFLFLATKCNPTILEVFLAPVVEADDLGIELRDTFKFVWNSKYVKDAFIGYGLNQRKKFLDNKDSRPHKYATAYLRTLYQGWELLNTGTFSVDLSKTEIYEILKRFKNGDYEVGEVIQTCYNWHEKVLKAYEKNPDKQTDFNNVNHFLLKVRSIIW